MVGKLVHKAYRAHAMTTNPQPSAEALRALALSITRYFYGFFNGGSAGPLSATTYFDETGRHQPGPKSNVETVLEMLDRSMSSRPVLTPERSSAGAELLLRLETELSAIRDAANENASGNPPDGYTELEPQALAIADKCYLHGLSAMETAVSNWVFDQRTALVKTRPRSEYDAGKMLVALARAAWCLADGTEGTEHEDEFGKHLRVPCDLFKDLTDALDALDALPELPRPYIGEGPAKAEHALGLGEGSTLALPAADTGAVGGNEALVTELSLAQKTLAACEDYFTARNLGETARLLTGKVIARNAALRAALAHHAGNAGHAGGGAK